MSDAYPIPTDPRPKDATAAQLAGWNDKITKDGAYPPAKGRYHLYLGHFCPYAQRVALIRYIKGLEDIIDISVVKTASKGDNTGWPGWRFPVSDEEQKDATTDKLFGSTWFHELYFKAKPDYAGRFSVPALWDKETNTIVSNDSLGLVRNLDSAFDELLPEEYAKIKVSPEALMPQIEAVEKVALGFGGGAFRASMAKTQEDYNNAVAMVYGSLNKLEKILAENGGPFLLGKDLTEADIIFYVLAVRFEVTTAAMTRMNLGTISTHYPFLNNWFRNLYWNVRGFKETTYFEHLKETVSLRLSSFLSRHTTNSSLQQKYHNPDLNPYNLIFAGPYPEVQEGVDDWKTLKVGEVTLPIVKEYESKL